MFPSYFKISFRSLKAHRLNSIINILGLSIGISCALIISFIVKYQLSFDSFHTYSDNIYRVVRVSLVEGETEYRTGTSWPLSSALKQDIAVLKDITSMIYFGGMQVDIINNDGKSVNKFHEKSGCVFVDDSFFNIFDFEDAPIIWIHGNSQNALSDPFSVVLTESMALKYFGKDMPLGKSLKLNQEVDVVVTGVISDLPSNTNFPFTLLVSYSTLHQIFDERTFENWHSVSDSHQTYIILPDGTSKSEMEKLIADVHEKYVGEEFARYRTYPLQSLNEVHSDSRFGNYSHSFTSKKSIWTLALVGIFLLVVVCINFVNISIAGSVGRSKEIGLRKVIGGNRNQIAFQYLMETFILTSIAALAAVLIAELLKPRLQLLFDFDVNGPFIFHPFVVIILISIILLVTIVAGLYPAIVISGFPPTSILGKSVSMRIGHKIKLSNALVLVQFTITLILVTFTLIVFQQMQYFNNVDLGFEKEAVINVSLPDNNPSLLNNLKNDLLAQSEIENVSFSSTLPSGLQRNRGYMDIKRTNSDSREGIIYEYQSADPEYLELYNIKLIAGRNISMNDTNQSVLINRTLLNKLGYRNPEESIGTQVDMNLDKPITIVGVMEDFHDSSLKDDFGKIGIIYNPDHFQVASIKLVLPNNGLNSADVKKALTSIENSWTSIYPDNVFEYDFLDKNIEAFYKVEQQFSQMFQYLSIIFLVIGCLGLYGLISFIINKKMKELAIRKIMGASTLSVLVMLLRNYLYLVLFAFVVASPIVYYFISDWLEKFAYHISLKWWHFFLPPALLLITALITISRHALKAARSNPSETLRYD